MTGMFGTPEQQIEVLRRMDLAGQPWQIHYFDHEKGKWIFALCDDRNNLKRVVLGIVERLEE